MGACVVITAGWYKLISGSHLRISSDYVTEKAWSGGAGQAGNGLGFNLKHYPVGIEMSFN